MLAVTFQSLFPGAGSDHQVSAQVRCAAKTRFELNPCHFLANRAQAKVR